MTASVTPSMPVPGAALIRELAIAAKVCVRPVLLRCSDTETGSTATVPIRCGSTVERVCPSCADRARRLRMQQCREGWHRDDEPERDDQPDDAGDGEPADSDNQLGDAEDQDDEQPDTPARRVRSTRRRQDAPDLPRVPMEDRTIGKAFTAPNGRTYRPSMFLTCTLDSYGRVHADGTPADPDSYDYRRAALDSLHFPRLVDRLWQNLRRCAGYKAQYFAVVEAQRRLAPHLHAAVRGVIPRHIVRQVVDATYQHLWWPAIGQPCPDDQLPVWDDHFGGFVDPTTGCVLPTWDQALDNLDADPAAKPAHVLRFGKQIDYQGILATDEDKVGKAVAYLTKYVTKDVSSTYGAPDDMTPRQLAHLERLHAQVKVLPCSPTCANWLRYGVQPKDAHAELVPGDCRRKAHDREHLGLGGRRVLVSRDWSGKTLAEHAADGADVVRQVLEDAGIDMPDRDRLSATQTGGDGNPRFVWTRIEHADQDALTYGEAIAAAIRERNRWREQYQAAKFRTGPPPDGLSATGTDTADSAA
jgi:hypothetical protein